MFFHNLFYFRRRSLLFRGLSSCHSVLERIIYKEIKLLFKKVFSFKLFKGIVSRNFVARQRSTLRVADPGEGPGGPGPHLILSEKAHFLWSTGIIFAEFNIHSQAGPLLSWRTGLDPPLPNTNMPSDVFGKAVVAKNGSHNCSTIS